MPIVASADIWRKVGAQREAGWAQQPFLPPLVWPRRGDAASPPLSASTLVFLTCWHPRRLSWLCAETKRSLTTVRDERAWFGASGRHRQGVRTRSTLRGRAVTWAGEDDLSRPATSSILCLPWVVSRIVRQLGTRFNNFFHISISFPLAFVCLFVCFYVSPCVP